MVSKVPKMEMAFRPGFEGQMRARGEILGAMLQLSMQKSPVTIRGGKTQKE